VIFLALLPALLVQGRSPPDNKQASDDNQNDAKIDDIFSRDEDVKSEDASMFSGQHGPPPCFPPESKVVTPFGQKRMDEIFLGDQVLDADAAWTSVIAFLHIDLKRRDVYTRVTIDEQHVLHLSPNHLIFRLTGEEAPEADAVQASELQIGDLLRLKNGTGHVSQLHSVLRQGAFSPLTYSGSMLVDNVWVSSYSTLGFGSAGISSHNFQHTVMAPLRGLAILIDQAGGFEMLREFILAPGPGKDSHGLLWYVRLWLGFGYLMKEETLREFMLVTREDNHSPMWYVRMLLGIK